MNDAILNAALDYAARGWSVIPISRNKQPLIEWKTATKKELTDPENIREWWRKFPAANVAIVTGARSGGLVVVDIDIDEDKGVNGMDSLEEWCEDHNVFGLESAATVETGRGGKHLYFQSDNVYHNQVGCLPGVDIRGEGGCIVAPPSIHGTTRRTYAWDIEEDEPVVPVADSDTVFFLASMEQTKGNAEHQKNDFSGKTSVGGRNNKLFKYAAHLQGRGEDDETIIEYVKDYNQRNLEPPLDDDEVQRTLDSVLSHKEWKGTTQAKPKHVEDPEQESEEEPCFEVINAWDLAHAKLPEIRYAVDGLVPEGLTIAAAPPKSGKSWLCLDMCLKVAKGEPFLGFKTMKCDVAYFALEDGDKFEQERLWKVCSPDDTPHNFNYVLKTGKATLEKGFLERLDTLKKRFPNLGLVIIDTLKFVACRQTKQESAYERDYRTGSMLKTWADKHGVAVLAITHTTKLVHPEDALANVSGTNGLTGAADAVMVIAKEKRTATDAVLAVDGRRIRQAEYEIKMNWDKCVWEFVGVGDPDERERISRERELAQLKASEIYKAIIALADHNVDGWEGGARRLKDDALQYGIFVMDTPMEIGRILTNNRVQFAKDGIKVDVIKNGTGANSYRIATWNKEE